MTTPINGTRLGTHPHGAEPQASRPAANKAGRVSTPGADEVALSPAAQQLATPSAGAGKVVPFDAARVAQLRDAIATSTRNAWPNVSPPSS